MRQARVCYDNLAGAPSVHMCDSLTAAGAFEHGLKGLCLTEAGQPQMNTLGIDFVPLDRAQARSAAPAWIGVPGSHLACGLGAALLSRFYDLNWARRVLDSRVVTFTPKGVQAFNEAFPLA